MEAGFLSIVLHGHLPYVRHPEHLSYFEENWFFQAITECYLPLINVFDSLHDDAIHYRLTLSLSPTLLAMLGDALLLSRYIKYLQERLELAEKEIIRTKNNPNLQKLARLYRRLYQQLLQNFIKRYNGNLITAFKKHHQSGNLELITTAATHGFLPLLNTTNNNIVRNQINIGINAFKDALGFKPQGFWLPECGYYPGIECLLADADIAYFFVDSHGLTNASQRPYYGVYAPIYCTNNVAAFARDPHSSQQVWSAQTGYPGDFSYREYYRDIGFDLELDIIAPYILDGKTRINTGIKYHQITGTNAKKIYQPRKATNKALLHAQDFIDKSQQHTNELYAEMQRTPIIVAPFDAELFGHWWFEGPQWLEQVLRLASHKNNRLKTICCSDYLAIYPKNQTATPSASTWGDQGYSSYWVNPDNDWIYPHLHQAGIKMESLANTFTLVDENSLLERALNQAARSLLLAQSSDWAFIIKSGTNTAYAKKKIIAQLARFNYLHDTISANNINERYLMALEQMDNIFPTINYRNYRSS